MLYAYAAKFNIIGNFKKLFFFDKILKKLLSFGEN
jgi:hypothetical protein